MAECIERNELIKRLETSINSWGRDCNSNAPTMVRAYQDVLYRVKNIPAADVVEVVHSKWIKRNNERRCPICQYFYMTNGTTVYNFCPMCGAKMDGEERTVTGNA